MWTLQQLRQWAETGNGVAAISRGEMRELVEDIEREIRRMYDEGKNEAKMLYERKHPYRDGCRVGWNGAIRKMRELFRKSERWHISGLEHELDELVHVNDVPEPEPKSKQEWISARIPVGNGTTEVLLNLEERMRQLERHLDIAKLTRNWEAPADSPLGIELSKIRDRLNALEMSGEAQTLSFDQRLTQLEKVKLDETFKTYSNFERRLNELVERIGVETALREEVGRRLVALEKYAAENGRVENAEDRIWKLEAAMRGHNEQVSEFENKMNEALSKALQRIGDRLEEIENWRAAVRA